MNILTEATINNERVLMSIGQGIDFIETFMDHYSHLSIVGTFQSPVTLYAFFYGNSSKTNFGKLI